MSENSIIPSLDNILDAVNYDFSTESYESYNPQQNNTPKGDEASPFDATKWYLQEYPNEKKQTDDTDSDTPKPKKPKKKKSKKIIKIIIIILVMLLGIPFVVNLFSSNDNYDSGYSNTYDNMQQYNSDSTYEDDYNYDPGYEELYLSESKYVFIGVNEIKIYRFIPEEDGTYRFYSVGDMDTMVEIYDSNQNLIDTFDDVISSEDELLGTNFDGDVYLNANQEYYVQVSLFDEFGGNTAINVAKY